MTPRFDSPRRTFLRSLVGGSALLPGIVSQLLAESASPSVAEDPLAPTFLAGALRRSVEALELGAGVRIVLFKFLERELGPTLGQVYDRANALLGGAGILPHLRTGQRMDGSTTGAGRAQHGAGWALRCLVLADLARHGA